MVTVKLLVYMQDLNELHTIMLQRRSLGNIITVLSFGPVKPNITIMVDVQ